MYHKRFVSICEDIKVKGTKLSVPEEMKYDVFSAFWKKTCCIRTQRYSKNLYTVYAENLFWYAFLGYLLFKWFACKLVISNCGENFHTGKVVKLYTCNCTYPKHLSTTESMFYVKTA